MSDEDLLISLGNLRAALRGEMLSRLTVEQRSRIAALHVDVLMKQIVNRSRLEGVPH